MSERRGIVSVLFRDGDLAVIAVAALLLCAGAVVRARTLGATTAYDNHGVHLAHPRGWVATEKPLRRGADVTITDLFGTSAWKPRVTVRVEPLPDAVLPEMVNDYVQLNAGHDLALYHALGARDVTVSGAKARRYEYAYALDPATAVADTDVPVVVRAVDLVTVRGRDLVTVGVAAPADDFQKERARFEAVLSSVGVR